MTRVARRHLPLALSAYLSACRQTTLVPADAGTYHALQTPEDVSIAGYDGEAMEPFFTGDGCYLLFNNGNEPPANTNLHWAERAKICCLLISVKFQVSTRRHSRGCPPWIERATSFRLDAHLPTNLVHDISRHI
jgi:hypothetical protein